MKTSRQCPVFSHAPTRAVFTRRLVPSSPPPHGRRESLNAALSQGCRRRRAQGRLLGAAGVKETLTLASPRTEELAKPRSRIVRPQSAVTLGPYRATAHTGASPAGRTSREIRRAHAEIAARADAFERQDYRSPRELRSPQVSAKTRRVYGEQIAARGGPATPGSPPLHLLDETPVRRDIGRRQAAAVGRGK